MKLSLLTGCAVLLAPAMAFHVAIPRGHRELSTSRYMFSGAGESAPKEDNPEELAKMEQAAKAMGMSVEEYQMAMNARLELVKEIDNCIVSGGKADLATMERDANNPPKMIKITITEDGKALGPEGLSKELVSAMKAASEKAKTGRASAQKNMMTYIGEQLKDGK